MKLMECLNEIGKHELRLINDKWGCCPKEGEFKDNYYRESIHDYLINYLQPDIENQVDLITHEMKEYLQEMVLGINDDNPSIESKLNDLGIIYNNIIPEELQEIILNLIMEEASQETHEYKISVKPTLFLKLLGTGGQGCCPRIIGSSYLTYKERSWSFISNRKPH